MLIGCECIDSLTKETIMRPIAETADELRLEPMECNARRWPPADLHRLAAPVRSSARPRNRRPARSSVTAQGRRRACRAAARQRAPFVGQKCRSSARSAVHRTAQCRCPIRANVEASIEPLGRYPCWRPA
ncbi:hypothetical protein EGY19_29495 [Burkholderia multivorans]|nr:hypothetical protein EGY19_29495 [Burkholderia multivorans]PRG53673.1 hypothetical protein C6T63_10500 [Burkholderia multivorans]